MTDPSHYHLEVTAGQKYTEHQPVGVNKDTPLTITSPLGKVELLVHVKDFRAISDSSCPANSDYFKDSSRASSRFSISWRLTPSKPINGANLMWVNDFDQPVKQLLPPFFGAALDVAKRWVDPGMEAEPYSDKPYIRGPALSSVNTLRIRNKDGGQFGKELVKEGADEGDAKVVQKKHEVPNDEAGRRKYFLEKKHRESWEFEAGRAYDCDFYNGYLDFNDFTLKLPMGISFNVLRMIGGDKAPPLRYVLKDIKDDTILFHVTFTLKKDETKSSETPVEKDTEVNPDLD